MQSRCICSVLLCGMLVIIGQQSQRAANSIQSQDPGEAGRKVVRIADGETTAGKLADEVRAQTGVLVELPPHLASHRLAILCDASTLRDLLDRVCAATGWEWRLRAADRIALDRPRPASPQSVADLARSISSCLPRDWREYLARPVEDAPGMEARSRIYRRIGVYEERVLQPSAAARLNAQVEQAALRLTGALPAVGGATEFASDRMSAANREELAACLVLNTLLSIVDSRPGGAVLLGAPPAWLVDLPKLRVRLKDRGIAIDHVDEIDGMVVERGFAADIQSGDQ